MTTEQRLYEEDLRASIEDAQERLGDATTEGEHESIQLELHRLVTEYNRVTAPTETKQIDLQQIRNAGF